MTEAKDPREEAERLIASVLGSASVAAEELTGFATGSAECCVCPVCRAIAAARQPNPNVAERIASGAGDLAQGLASVLRTISGGLGGFPAGFPGGSRPAPGGTATATDEDPWHTATRAAAEAEAAGAAPGSAAPAAPPNPPKPAAAPPKPMAKKATKPKVVPPTGPGPATEPEEN